MYAAVNKDKQSCQLNKVHNNFLPSYRCSAMNFVTLETL